MKTQINGKEAEWTEEIQAHWNAKLAPLFTEKESCSTANYFTPRPYRNEYDRGSHKFGFVYIVMPGSRVCVRDWSDHV